MDETTFQQYCAHGSRAYRVASRMEPHDSAQQSSDLLGRLAERFELCALGLREVRREWERNDDAEGGVGGSVFK